MRQQLILLLFLICTFLAPLSDGFAHSGGTDSKGGHYDRSTGQYHYHHGYEAHQHPNGVCPYEKKVTVTNRPTYSKTYTNPTATPKRLIVVTARPSVPSLLSLATSTPRPASTSNVRPAVTVGPGSKATSTPRHTAKPTSTPRITSTPSPRTTSSTSVSLHSSEDMSHVLYYGILGGVSLVSLLSAIITSRRRVRDLRKAQADTKCQVENAVKEAKRASEKEIRHAYAEISTLEHKLEESDARQRIAADLAERIESSDAEALKEAEQKFQVANAKISELVQQQREYRKNISDLKAELKKAQEDAMPPRLMYVPPVPDPFPEVGDLRRFYSVHYPTTWNYILRRSLNANSYLNYYHYVWGNLQINHGDGFVHGELTEDQRALVNYPPPGKYIYVSSLDSSRYHNTSNCYDLLQYRPIECNRSCVDRYIPCTKCVNQ